MYQILNGDCLQMLKTLPEKSVNCIVTSPPYYGLRDYGHDDQIGLEQSPDEYIEKLVSVFRECKRVLKDDGTLWVNIGDSYAGSGKGMNADGSRTINSEVQKTNQGSFNGNLPKKFEARNIKPKDLIGIPWMLAFALRKDGWYLRQDIIWSKPNVMPESVTDRCTKSHEYIFLLSKYSTYYYDADSIKEPCKEQSKDRYEYSFNQQEFGKSYRPGGAINTVAKKHYTGFRNKRSVWTVTNKPYKGHHATYPEDLVYPCIMAGCPPKGTVLDPFSGSGTTGACAVQHDRNYIGIELNPEFAALSDDRLYELTKQISMFEEA